MDRAVLVGFATLSLLQFACGSGSSNTPDAAAIATCPDELDLAKTTLPCDCYGNEANSTTILDPSCKTQVVCCPGIGNLRCEDHEYVSDDGGWADGIKTCPDEVDLSTIALPCNCYGIIVAHTEQAMPECTGVVKCCPAEQGLKCE